VKALIKVGYGCNDHCTFCHTLDVRHIDAEASEVHAKIERAKQLGHRMVVLSGGEPTIRPELYRWAEHVARLDMDFGLVTNGRVLSYPEVVEKLLERRLKYVYLSLHGGSAKVHNLMVRSDAFDETFGALRNLSGKGIDLTVNCVITRHNVRHLSELVEACLPYADAKVKLSMVEPKGGGDRLFDHLMPKIEEVGERVLAALEHGRRRIAERGGQGPTLLHGGVPLCLLPGWEHAYDDLRTHRFATMIEVGEPDFFPVDDDNKTQPESTCRGCSLRGACPGLYTGYLEAFGSAALKPVHDLEVGNSYDHAFEAMVRIDLEEPLTVDGCPVRAEGITPWDRGRHVFVRNGPRLGRYWAKGRDFHDVEMRETKNAHEQLYVDVSGPKSAPDDFTKDLRKLRRMAVCDPCPDKARCTGIWEVQPADDAGRSVFEADEATVRAHVAALRGDVLDVGCGELPYAEAVRAAVQAGARWTGIDPDAARLATLEVPGARWQVGRAEDVADDAAFDHIVVLRSYQHFERVPDALARLFAALRPGGSLFVVDDAPFGLLRTPAQIARAQRGPARLEHRRRDVAKDAAPKIAAAGFALDEVREVGPRTSTLWWVRARRPG
jgi:MoaA/NifB/PqqE/SkfB family radical SAM enzyme/SAM-dependent methyltransferase